MSTNSGEATMVALIFCDLTASVDSAAIEKVARDAYKLMLSFPPETRLYILPIDESPFIEPILDFTYPKRAARFSEIEKNKTRVRAEAKRVYEKIKKLYHEMFSSAAIKPKPLSCLLRSLETAHSYFSRFGAIKNKKFTFELIYFSDMIEECSNSPIGPVFLKKANFPAALIGLKSYNPDFDLSYANVSIIVSVRGLGKDSHYVSPEQLKEFWKNVFAKTGFTTEQLREFSFFSSIPPRFELNHSPWK